MAKRRGVALSKGDTTTTALTRIAPHLGGERAGRFHGGTTRCTTQQGILLHPAPHIVQHAWVKIDPPSIMQGGTVGLLNGGVTGREKICDLTLLDFANVKVCRVGQFSADL